MKNIVVSLILIACINGCATNSDKQNSIHPQKNMITIKYTSDRTFEILNTGVKYDNLEELSKALADEKNPYIDYEYEIYAVAKSIPEVSDEIIATVKKTGVKLNHYWAPVSSINPKATAGKYGLGYADIIDDYLCEK